MSESPSSPPVWDEPEHYLQLARRHYENFPVGSWLLPRVARRHLVRIYAFARTADDLADELRDAAALAAFRSDFMAHASGQRVDVPLFVDVVATIDDCQLPVTLFTDLLDAFEQDLVVTDYDHASLRDYCRRSADPVGRLVLRVFGYREDVLDRLSDRICTALQLVNHLQDIGSDLRERGRIYLPREDLVRFGVDRPMLLEAVANRNVRALVLHWVDRLVGELSVGFELAHRVRGRLRCELRAIVRGAAAVLARIRAADGDVLGTAVQLTRRQQMACGLLGLLSRRRPRILRQEPVA